LDTNLFSDKIVARNCGRGYNKLTICGACDKGNLLKKEKERVWEKESGKCGC
jgi:hypothetical protein